MRTAGAPGARRLMVGDRQQPNSKARRIPKRPKICEGFEECFLGGILCRVPMSQSSEARRADRTFIPPHELFEGQRVAAQRVGNQRRIRMPQIGCQAWG